MFYFGFDLCLLDLVQPISEKLEKLLLSFSNNMTLNFKIDFPKEN